MFSWQSTVEQCFLVEQPQGTLVVVDYELPQFAKQVGDMRVRVAVSVDGRIIDRPAPLHPNPHTTGLPSTTKPKNRR